MMCEFLKDIAPFKYIDSSRLRQLCTGLEIEEYASGEEVATAADSICDVLRVVRSGTIKRYLVGQDESLVPVDVLGQGDSFGFLQLMHEEYRKVKSITMEPTVCYVVRKEDVFTLLSEKPSLIDTLIGKSSSFYDAVTERVRVENRGGGLMGGEKLLFITTVGELVTREAVTVQEDTPIADAADLMSRHHISSLVVVSPEGAPIGIVTDRDLRDKVLARRRSLEDRIGSIMSSIIVKAEAKEYCYEALLRMIRYNVHHIVVLDSGELRGVITNHDFMLLQGVSPLAILKEMESQLAARTSVTASKSLEHLVGLLARDGARASSITRIIAEMNDRIVLLALEQVETRLGRPPLPYCWISYGSEGRKEQTFRTDQDNGLIYADPASAAQAAEAEEYFARLAAQMAETLERIGFPLCRAGYMATNPLWRQPLSQWKKYFTGWIETPTAEAVLSSLIFFDFRPIGGDLSLGAELREHLHRMINDKRIFLGSMANVIIRNAPPVTMFGGIKLETLAEHKGTINLKLKGAALVIDIVRFLSLEVHGEGHSTVERIRALRGRHSIIDTYGDELEQTFELIMMQRIMHQHRLIQAGLEPDNFVRPEEMGQFAYKQLRQAYSLIGRVQQEIIDRYKFMIV